MPLTLQVSRMGAAAEKRELDEDPDEEIIPYPYTTLINLSDIIAKQWGWISQRLPAAASKNKNDLLKDFRSINQIRNRIMHPLRSKHTPSDEDYRFVRTFHQKLVLTPWR